jgi:trimethylamine--corrinoid protein Co-methyltransferase
MFTPFCHYLEEKRMSRGGIRASHYRPLSQEALEQMHHAALEILKSVGLNVHSEKCRQALKSVGAIVEGKRVKLPVSVVEEAIQSAPSSVTLYGRDGTDHDLHVEENRVYLGTGGTVLQVLDLDGNYREASLQDLKDICRLVDALDAIHFIVLPTYPVELPAERVDLNRFYAGLRFSRKHIMGGVYTAEGIDQVIRLGEMVAGGKEALRQHPILSFIICLISPLTIDEKYGDFLCQICESGLPVVISLEPLSGTTAPLTLAGNLTQWAAEVLGGLVLCQAVRSGTPTIIGSVATVCDLKTMGYLSGAVEMGVLNAGGAQLAQYWKLPYYATAGMSDSKIPDAQAGYEKALTALTTALAGANYIHDAAGLLNFTMTASYEQYVIDNEILGMIERTLSGIEVDADHLATEVIREVGPGGNYMIHEHTVRFLRSEFYQPRVSEREHLDQWRAKGALDARQRANRIAREILSKNPRNYLPNKVDREILNEFGSVLSTNGER